MIDVRQGIGMTSARTRDRLVQRLRDQGIRNEAVLEQIANLGGIRRCCRPHPDA